MASAVKEDNLPDAVEAIIFSFTESTTVDECRKLYADWAPTHERVTFALFVCSSGADPESFESEGRDPKFGRREPKKTTF